MTDPAAPLGTPASGHLHDVGATVRVLIDARALAHFAPGDTDASMAASLLFAADHSEVTALACGLGVLLDYVATGDDDDALTVARALLTIARTHLHHCPRKDTP